jgi:hypothetical protein
MHKAQCLTGFRQVVVLLEQVRHQSEEGNKASQHGDNGVEVGKLQRDGPNAGHSGYSSADACSISTPQENGSTREEMKDTLDDMERRHARRVALICLSVMEIAPVLIGADASLNPI